MDSSMNMTDSANSSSTDSSSMDSMMMKAYLHFTPGDTLIFQGIAPASSGAIFGACLIFFLVSVSERWLRATARGAEARLAQRTKHLVSYAVFDEAHARSAAPSDKDSAPRTFNAAFIINVILGVVVGETAFGRWNYH
ncbi:hypothetical protein FB451DRAFT_1415295 [Mycena latifolia]|nr:hypothetical protein FB451DRAFT_1415295 [Mycena latifolia]